MFPPRFPPQSQPEEKISALEEAMLQLVNNTNQFMTKTKTQLQSQASSIRNLEVQLGQLSSNINNYPQGALSSNTEENTKRDVYEHCKVVTLRSGNH